MAAEVEAAFLQLAKGRERDDVVLVARAPCATIRALDDEEDDVWSIPARRRGRGWSKSVSLTKADGAVACFRRPWDLFEEVAPEVRASFLWIRSGVVAPRLAFRAVGDAKRTAHPRVGVVRVDIFVVVRLGVLEARRLRQRGAALRGGEEGGMIGRRHAVRDRGGCEAQEREGTEGMHILEEYTMAHTVLVGPAGAKE